MAATCVALPPSDGPGSVYYRQRILKSTTGWAEKLQIQCSPEVRIADTTYGYGGRPSSRRYHTANSRPPTTPTPASRTSDFRPRTDDRISVLVAQLLQSIAPPPAPYGSLPADDDGDRLLLAAHEDEALARVCIASDSSAPLANCRRARTSTSKPQPDMDFSIDFGSSAGFKSHAKKKKPAPAKFDPWPGDSNEKKDDTAANGSGGGGDGAAGGNGGDAAGAGGGGDDNNGGGHDDDDAWGFAPSKSKKKNSKKKQEEEQEEERKRKEEEEAKAAANPDPLSWADDANADAANDDWTMSWGGPKKKEKNKKDAGTLGTTSTFQDISLDDTTPKLDFSFDGLGDSKKNESSGGFGGWSKSWDLGGLGKTEEKKEESSDFGTNNPWGLSGSKNKKKAPLSNFDFGDFETSNNNDLGFGGGDDVTDSKAADDAWGFSSAGKKDKKKKGAIEEIKEDPPAATEKEEDSWGGWGTKKPTKTKKKTGVEEAFSDTTLDNAADPSFDWSFGSKDKKKGSIAEFEDKPKEDDGDPWGTFSTGKDKKKGKKGLLDDDFLPPAPEPAPEPEPIKEPLIAWDANLSAKEKKKKEKQMKLDGTWDDRVTQEMVDAEAEAAAAKAAEAAAAPEPEPEPIPPPPPLVEKVAWDHGLTAVKKRRKEKEMKLDGTWESRITQEMIDAEKEAAAAAVVDPEPEPEPEPEPPAPAETDATPLEDLLPWDYMLSVKDKKKKEKELRANGEWDGRLTQDKIDQMIADRDAAAAEAVPEPEPEPEPAAEPESALEDLVPWDYGLTPKERRKKEKEMKLDGSWEDRLTQEIIDEKKAAAAAAAEAANEPEPELEPEPEPEPAAPTETLEELEKLVPWDYGLKLKEKKKKQSQMQQDGTWDDRLTQDIIDEKIAAARAALATAEAAEPEPEPIAEPEPEPEPEPVVEEKRPWDFGLNTKEKKKKEKQMKLDGTWEDRLTQERIDEEAAAAAAEAVEPEPEPMPEEVVQEPEPEPEPRVPWDFGLNAKERKKKEKQMKLDGTWEDRLTQEKIDEEAAAAAAETAEPEPEPEPEEVAQEPEPEPEPRVPWDFGLNTKERKKKERQMKLDGTWEDRLTQEQIDEDAIKAAAAAEPDPEPIPEPDPIVEQPPDSGWGFGWGAGKSKTKKKSLLDPAPEKPEEKADDGWGGSWGFGLGKDKKKASTPVAEEPLPEPEPEPVKQDKVDDTWGFGASSKDKKKKSAKKSDLFEPVTEEPPPPPPPAEPATAEDDMWAAFNKTDKKAKKGKKGVEEIPPPPPPEPEEDPAPIPSLDDFNWDGLGSGKKSNKSPVEEAPAKKSSGSIWGFGSSTSAAKTKKEKEKEAKAKREEEERLQHEAEEAEAAAKVEADRLAAEEAAKAAKKTKSGKLSKTVSRTEGKKNDNLLDLLDDSVQTAKSSSSKLKKTSTKVSDNKLEDLPEETNNASTDYFSFWGSSSKKTAGKKSTDDKKEIKTSVLTNEEDALLAELNDDEIQAILDDTPAPSSPKLTKTMSNGRTKSNSSVADRIKALETKKEDAGKESKSTSATLINEEAEEAVALTPKEAKKTAKGKTLAKSSKTKVVQPPSPPLEEVEQKRSRESVPGSFPGAGDEEEDLLVDETPPPPVPEPEPAVSKARKSSRVEKKVSKTSSSKKKLTADVVTFEEPMDLGGEPEPVTVDFFGEPAKLPTPPPETGRKSAKKERPRVERSATASWGFWGASAAPPKKPTRSKTIDDISPPSSKKAKSPPALTRSKSTRSSKKEELDDGKDIEKTSKTSGSDKEGNPKQSERPKPTRGKSFTNFMLGGAPPSAMRSGPTARRSSTSGSKSSSRRQSMVDSGLISPPPDDESPVTSKAAKLMGFTGGKPVRRSSTKEKSKSYADPYPIDDDDVVMIHTKDKDAEPTPRSKPKKKIITDTKRSSTKPRSKTLSGDEDVVMVDSPLAMDSANEDFERPQLQRSNTGRKSTGFLSSLTGGLFGGGSRTPVERSRSTPATDNEDNVPADRSRGNSRRRSRVLSPADGFTTDAPGETDADVAARRADRRAKRAAAEKAEEEEKRLAREQRRRERREREKADLEARRERAREQARKEREAEEQRKEERRARRREKEAERARIAQEEAEAEAAAQRRREERRKLREQLEAEAGIKPMSKNDRRRTYAGEEEVRRRRRDENGKSRPKTSARRSTALMEEYHESRSGSGRGIKPPEDKTSSWVASQNDEPPDMPPVEPTVLDESGQVPRPVDDADAGSRKRRKDKYAGMTEEEIAIARAKRRERRLIEKSTSGGSDEKMQRKSPSKRQNRIYEDNFYADPVKTFDGKPQQSKRSSFLGKFF